MIQIFLDNTYPGPGRKPGRELLQGHRGGHGRDSRRGYGMRPGEGQGNTPLLLVIGC